MYAVTIPPQAGLPKLMDVSVVRLWTSEKNKRGTFGSSICIEDCAVMMENPIHILQRKMVFAMILLIVFMRIKRETFGWAAILSGTQGAEVFAATMESPLPVFQQETDLLILMFGQL